MRFSGLQANILEKGILLEIESSQLTIGGPSCSVAEGSGGWRAAVREAEAALQLLAGATGPVGKAYSCSW